MRKYSAKVDRNQSEIVKVLRAAGATVQICAGVGRGCPDLSVGLRGVNLWIEIKDGELEPARRRLTQLEQEWHDEWHGQVCIIETTDEALELLRTIP